MPILRIYDAWEIHDTNGIKHSGGSRSAPTEIECDGVISDQFHQLEPAEVWNSWQSGADTPADFDFLWIRSDRDIQIELTVDVGGEVGVQTIAVQVPATIPFRLIYDDALAAYTSPFVVGTLDVIDCVRVKNVDDSAALVQRAIVT